MPAAILKFARWASFGLARRLTLVLSSVILLCAGAILGISLFVQKQMIEDRLNLNAIHLSSLIKQVSIPAILRDEPASLTVFFEELEQRTDIVSVELVDLKGWLWMAVDADPASWNGPLDDTFLQEAMAQRQAQQVLGEHYLHRAGPIQANGEVIGFLNLRVARAPIEEELHGLWVSIGMIGLAILIVGPFAAWIIAQRLSKPLLSLEGASRRVAGGDFSHRVESNSNDEFDLVASSFNNMLDALHGAYLEIKRVAYEDKLTGVPNRSWLSLQIENLTAKPDRTPNFSILYLDVDKFKEVNDTHGHHAGDMLLCEFANRLLASVVQMDLVAPGVRVQVDKELALAEGEALLSRLGGDEFTVLVESGRAEELSRAILRAMQEPFELDGITLTVSASIGIAHYPDHATSSEQLLKCADVAMYQAKHEARGTFAVYDRAKHEELLQQSQMEKDLDRAVLNDEFQMFLQPKFDVETEKVIGAEALIRWFHPEKGYVRPDDFLPIAAGMGLMPRLGELMMNKAIRAAAHLNAGRARPLTIAVNIASEELLADGFADRLERNLTESALPAHLLEVEVTEGTAMARNAQVEHNIVQLRKLGVTLAVDDFGVGYSNLGRLKSLAFDTLKIDRSLIADVVSDEAARGLFQTILDMANVLNAQVVSEGVETAEQLGFLKELGVKTYQGFFGAPPMSLPEFTLWLKARPRQTASRDAGDRLAS